MLLKLLSNPRTRLKGREAVAVAELHGKVREVLRRNGLDEP